MKYINPILILLLCKPISNDLWDYLAIWDVGQGQFITYSTANTCYHIDMGGEKFSYLKTLRQLCHNKKNLIYLTHWDWDHISFLKKVPYWLPNPCIAFISKTTASKKKLKMVEKIPRCKDPSKALNLIYNPQKNKRLSANDLSAVFIANKSILIPGDSTKKMEAIWKDNIKKPSMIKHLILGHHGSKTSTSRKLLMALPQLTQATCSARKKKYGHPHYLVKKNLRDFSLRPVCTEIFGTMIFKL